MSVLLLAGKGEHKQEDLRFFETLPYQKTFCPEQSSGTVPVFCDRECGKFIVRTQFGKVVFAGCSDKWVAMCCNSSL